MKNLSFLSEIRTITLDWGDTLAHVIGKDQEFYDFRRLYQTLKTLDLNTNDLELQQKSRSIIRELTENYLTNYNLPNRNWIDVNKSSILKPLLQKEFPNYRFDWIKIFESFCFQDERIIPFYAGLPELFTEFKDHGWKIGILSHVNYEETFVKANFKKNKLDHLIDFYSLSGDIGFTKPHPAHFQDAIKKSGCRANQILHIGDHPEKDGNGSLQNGLHCGLIIEPGNYGKKEISKIDADLFIMSIFELRHVWQEYKDNPNSTFYSQYP